MLDCLLGLLALFALANFLLFLGGIISAWWTTRHEPRRYSELYLARERDDLERQAREYEARP